MNITERFSVQVFFVRKRESAKIWGYRSLVEKLGYFFRIGRVFDLPVIEWMF